ncbi:MAG: hypothetical protein AAB366_00725 [Patescibacteria group bacterium]
MNKLFIEIIGWYGVLAILIAYLFISFGIIGAESATYQILNFSGAIGIIAISLLKKNIPTSSA